MMLSEPVATALPAKRQAFDASAALPQCENSRHVMVSAGSRIVIVPQVSDRIEPMDDAVFHFQFYK